MAPRTIPAPKPVPPRRPGHQALVPHPFYPRKSKDAILTGGNGVLSFLPLPCANLLPPPPHTPARVRRFCRATAACLPVRNTCQALTLAWLCSCRVMRKIQSGLGVSRSGRTSTPSAYSRSRKKVRRYPAWDAFVRPFARCCLRRMTWRSCFSALVARQEGAEVRTGCCWFGGLPAFGPFVGLYMG